MTGRRYTYADLMVAFAVGFGAGMGVLYVIADRLGVW